MFGGANSIKYMKYVIHKVRYNFMHIETDQCFLRLNTNTVLPMMAGNYFNDVNI